MADFFPNTEVRSRPRKVEDLFSAFLERQGVPPRHNKKLAETLSDVSIASGATLLRDYLTADKDGGALQKILAGIGLVPFMAPLSRVSRGVRKSLPGDLPNTTRGLPRNTPVFHGATEMDRVKSILKEGFREGRSAELHTPGTSVTRDPSIAAVSFGGDEQLFNVLRVDIPDDMMSRVLNLSPSKYALLESNGLKLENDIVSLPQSYYHEVEIFLNKIGRRLVSTEPLNTKLFHHADGIIRKVKFADTRLNALRTSLKQSKDYLIKKTTAEKDYFKAIPWTKGVVAELHMPSSITEIIKQQLATGSRAYRAQAWQEIHRNLLPGMTKIYPFYSNTFKRSFRPMTNGLRETSDAWVNMRKAITNLKAKVSDGTIPADQLEHASKKVDDLYRIYVKKREQVYKVIEDLNPSLAEDVAFKKNFKSPSEQGASKIAHKIAKLDDQAKDLGIDLDEKWFKLNPSQKKVRIIHEKKLNESIKKMTGVLGGPKDVGY